MVFQLIYLSRAANQAPDELESILSSSRRNNSVDHLTGILLHGAGVYLQLIEGQEFAVRRLFEKIQRDARHHNVVCVIEQNNTQRLFGEWSMDVQKVDEFDPVILQCFSRWDKWMPTEGAVANNLIMRMLLDFKKFSA